MSEVNLSQQPITDWQNRQIEQLVHGQGQHCFYPAAAVKIECDTFGKVTPKRNL